MRSRTWLACIGVCCTVADWTFKLGGWPDLVSTKWFLASCIFFAAWGVAAHIDERGDRQ